MFDLGLSSTAWAWIWMVAAVVFAAVELKVVRRDFLVLPWAIAAFMAGVSGFFGASPLTQAEVFVIGGMALFIVFGRVRRWTEQFADNDN